MIDKLIDAVRGEAWSDAAKLLYDHWSEQCVLLYTGNDTEPWDTKLDDDGINEQLLAPFAAMYTLQYQKPEKGKQVSLRLLTEQLGLPETDRRPGQICGKVFKNGDHTFSCTECKTDNTCVLCQDCFKQSAHVNHIYKMHTSYGAGYCDCGDAEAFKKDFACRLHTIEPQPGDEKLNLHAVLPPETCVRVSNLTGIAMKYISTLICWQETNVLPPFLRDCQLPDGVKMYKTILFNDETHTYDAVISALELAIHCSKQQAMYLATIVDREGRAAVMSHSFNICEVARSTIQNRTQRSSSRRTDKSGPLDVKVMRTTLFAHQAFAIKLFTWLSDQAQQYPVIGSVIGRMLLTTCSSLCTVLPSDVFNVPVAPPKPVRTPEKEPFLRGDILQRVVVQQPGNNDDDMADPPLTMNISQDPTSHTVPGYERRHVCNPDNSLECGHLSFCSLLCLYDRRLWKAARVSFRKLLMSTVLKNVDQRLEFGIFMIRNYEFIYREYIDDDHEHNMSIVALGIQFYTVPSVSLHLVEHENALAIIFEMIRVSCQPYLVRAANIHHLVRFDFSHATMPAVLRRALEMFRDSDNLLQAEPSTPEAWTIDMMDSFVAAAEVFIDFLTCMQGIDPVKRQLDQHQLYDSEWETAFNIQVRFQDCLFRMIIWACQHPYVHQRVVRMVFDRMHEFYHADSTFAHPFEHSASIDEFSSHVIKFSFANMYISVHQPLWRFFAGLFTAPPDVLRHYALGDTVSPPDKDSGLHPNRNYMSITSSELVNSTAWSKHEPVEHVYIWPLYALLEMPLRVFVLHTQHNLGMWRRNGFSLVNQLHNYEAQVCRNEMYDRDFQMIQLVAAHMNSDDFLIRILSKFNIDQWATDDYEDRMMNKTITVESAGTPTPMSSSDELSRTIVFMAESCLVLIIQLLCERFTPGIGCVTITQALEREVMHLLFTGPKPYSALESAMNLNSFYKVLPHNLRFKNVADFKAPHRTAPGLFHIKESLRDQYCAFFYHYTRAQYGQAEQTQSAERALLSRDLQACPPPKLPPFEPMYHTVLRLLDSKLLAKIMKLNLERFIRRSRYSSDNLVHVVLYIIGIGLNEELSVLEKTHNKPSYDDDRFLANMENLGIFDILKSLEGKKIVEQYQHLLWWVLNQYKAVRMFSTSADNDVMDTSVRAETKNEQSAEQEAERRAKRLAMGVKKRELAMKKMLKMQKAFKQGVEANKESTAIGAGAAAALENVTDEEDEEEQGILLSDTAPVCLGPHKSKLILKTNRMLTCILCQEKGPLQFSGQSFACCGFVQNSKLFKLNSAPTDASFFDNTDVFLPASLLDGYNVSTCSHTVHVDCFKVLTDALWARDRNRVRSQMMGHNIIDAANFEFLCPLCKRLSNCAIPLIPIPSVLSGVSSFAESRPVATEVFDDWVDRLTRLADMPLNSTAISSSASASIAARKAHSRKRSHSERSLQELQKTQKDLPIGLDAAHSSNMSASQPSVAEISASATSSSSMADTAAALASANIGTAGGNNDGGNVEMADFQQQHNSNFINKFKFSITKLIPQKLDNVPPGVTTWPVIRSFVDYLHRVGQEPKMKNISDAVRIYQATAFVVRSVAASLDAESKPLFGALNTRQRDCIQCMARLSQVAAFNMRPAQCRLLVSRLMTPLLVPLSEQKNMDDIILENSSNRGRSPGVLQEIRRIASGVASSSSSAANSANSSGINVPATGSSAMGLSDAKSPKLSLDLVPTDVAEYLKQCLHHEMNIMTVDMLSLAVELCMTIGWTWTYTDAGQKQVLHTNVPSSDCQIKFPDGESVDELYSLRLVLLGYIFQCVVTFPFPSSADSEMLFDPDCSMDVDDAVYNGSSETQDKLSELLRHLTIINPIYGDINVVDLERHLKTSVAHFLKPMALLYHFVTLVPSPDVLKHASMSDCTSLSRYLGLPDNLNDLLSGFTVDRLFSYWSFHVQALEGKLEHLVRQPIYPRRLINLPHEYTDLLIAAVNVTPSCRCSVSDEVGINQPSMCLACGKIMCSQSYCCQAIINDEPLGACNNHMRTCTGSSGLFLRIREGQIAMLTSRKRGAFRPAPYVDEFGEHDTGLTRGNPLFLNPEIYRKLQRIWLHQEVAETIIDQYDTHQRNHNVEWNNF